MGDFAISDRTAELLFPILDKDGSGTLDALEVFIGLAIMCSDSREKKMYTVFNIMDADKSGKITKAELRRFIALIAPRTIADADIDNMVNGCLKDADMGSSKSITFEKFLQWKGKSVGFAWVQLLLDQMMQALEDDDKAPASLLQVLNLTNVWQLDEGYDHVVRLAAGIGNCASLQELHLGYNSLGVPPIATLTAALVNTKKLSLLDLSGNPLGVIGAEAVSLLLRQNSTITCLHLEGCQLGSQGIEAIATALWDTNMTVKAVGLSDNEAGNSGAAAMSMCLKDSSTITRLDLSNNGMDAGCTSVLADAIEQNRGLVRLDLSSNNLGVDGLKDLIQVVALHQQIKSFDVRYTIDTVGFKVDDVVAKRMTYCQLCNSLFNGKLYTICNICNIKGPTKPMVHIVRLN